MIIELTPGSCLVLSSKSQSTQDLSQIKIGMANLFVQHTSASLTINENADPDVRRDMEVALNKLVPASWNRDGTFLHTMEGDLDTSWRNIRVEVTRLTYIFLAM